MCSCKIHVSSDFLFFCEFSSCCCLVVEQRFLFVFSSFFFACSSSLDDVDYLCFVVLRFLVVFLDCSYSFCELSSLSDPDIHVSYVCGYGQYDNICDNCSWWYGGSTAFVKIIVVVFFVTTMEQTLFSTIATECIISFVSNLHSIWCKFQTRTSFMSTSLWPILEGSHNVWGTSICVLSITCQIILLPGFLQSALFNDTYLVMFDTFKTLKMLYDLFWL